MMLICPPDDGVRQDRPARHPGQLHAGLRHRRARRRLRTDRVCCEVRAPAQPGDPAAGRAQLHHQGPDPGADGALPRHHRRGLRPDVRARQGRPARARHPARGRLRRQVLRGRAGLPDQARRVRAARDRLRRRRGGRARASRPRCGGTPASPPPPPTPWSSSRPPGSASTASSWTTSLRRWPRRSRRSRRCGRPPCTARRCASTTPGPERRESRTRHLQPWGVVTAQGRWYVAGFDTDRGEPRMFRLSRIVSSVQADGDAGSYTVPEGTDLRELSESLAPRRPDRTAVGAGPRRARPTACAAAPRSARPVSPGPDGALGWDELQVPYVSETDFAGSCWGTPTRWSPSRPTSCARPSSSRLRGIDRARPEDRVDERRTRAGLAAAGAGALPPDAHGRVAGPGGRRLRRAPRPDHEGPQGPLDVRAPGPDPRQDDRRRLRGDRGRPRRRRTHRQRRLPLRARSGSAAPRPRR